MTTAAPSFSKGTIILTCYGLTDCVKMEKSYARLISALQKAFPKYKVRLALSSKQIRNILQKQGRLYCSLSEVLEQEYLFHTENVLVLNTHFLPGKESQTIAETVKFYSDFFPCLISTSPILLNLEIRDFLLQKYTHVLHTVTKGKMQVLAIVHGSPFIAPYTFTTLNASSHCRAIPLTFLSMTSHPSVQHWIQTHKPNNEMPILLTPFMMLSGRHTVRDIYGEAPGALQKLLQSAGYKTYAVPLELGTMDFFPDLLVQIALKSFLNFSQK